jgi:hypothetical protein
VIPLKPLRRLSLPAPLDAANPVRPIDTRMPHLFVIFVLVSLSLAGGSGLESAPGAVRTWQDGLLPAGIGPGSRLALAGAVFVAIGAAAWAGVALSVRALDRRGRAGAVAWAWRVITIARSRRCSGTSRRCSSWACSGWCAP